jgi:uroporphyrinogen-III decarboxylase
MTTQTPRQLAKDLLQGNPPSRPLVVPIVFSLGAKIENLSLRAFLDNPTKISNTLRQIRTHLPTDGVSCYFDPYLELEVLGVAADWDSTNQTRTIHWPEQPRKGELPPGLRSPEEAVESPRVRVAIEVIRRLNSLLRYEPLLMAGVTGPFTLAARLAQLDAGEVSRGGEPPESALDLAAGVIRKISSAFVEAGANLIFIREEILPNLSPGKCQAWASLLAPVFNIIRFYQSLPVLQLASERSHAENMDVILEQSLDAILCTTSADFATRAANHAACPMYGLALSLEEPQTTPSAGEFRPINSKRKPALLTTGSDVPVATDLKRLMMRFEWVSRQI